jgi:FkbM family methyltransferase
MVTKHYDLGLRSLLKFRPYTEDEELVRRILIERTEYHLFIGSNPRVIFDIGANIGCTSVLFANSYPNAIIYAFEPVPENYELLVENVKAYPNVQPINLALGAKTEERKIMASDDEYNFGGFSFHEKGSDPLKTQSVQVMDIIEFMESKSIQKIDLLKIDTEGCEKEILWRLYPNFLPKHIMGECHGHDDWEMFKFLFESHDIKTKKEFGQRCFPFYAMRKADA